MTTITANITGGLTLTSPGDTNPIGIGTGVSVTNAAGDGLLSAVGYYWTVTNAGTISGAGTAASADAGIAMAGGAAITNASANAVISGYGFGVTLGAAGTVVNRGLIEASQTSGAAYVYYGSLTAVTGGVVTNGGGVYNAAGGTITAPLMGVGLNGGGSLLNAGAISGSQSTEGIGVLLNGTGSVTNTGSGSIYGGRFGILSFGAPATVTNNGGIDGNTDFGVWLFSGGSVTNEGTGRITGDRYGLYISSSAGTVTNQGQIEATATTPTYFTDSSNVVLALAESGVLFGAGGSVTNLPGGTISGLLNGVMINGGLGTVSNAGILAGTGAVLTYASYYGEIVGFRRTAGVYLSEGGTVTNAAGGAISGLVYGVAAITGAGTVTNAGSIGNNDPAFGAGVALESGGSVTNTTSGAAVGTITGSLNGVTIGGTPGIVFNAGVIEGTGTGLLNATYGSSGQVESFLPGGGVYLSDGGSVTNASGAVISDLVYGVLVTGGIGTVVNAGSIASTGAKTGAGVKLAAGGTLSNAATGVITGNWIGVQVGAVASAASNPSTIINQGTITGFDSTTGNGADLWLRGPSYVLNGQGGVLGGGPYGIVLYDQTTVVNLGSIQSSIIQGNDPATTTSLLLEEAPAASISGAVVAPLGGTAGQAGNVLELLSGASAGTIVSFGDSASYQFQNFGEVLLQNGGTWSLGGTVASSQTIAFSGTADTGLLTFADPAAVSGTITGFGPHETIALAGITDVTGVSLASNGTVLSVFQSSGPTLTFDFNPATTAPGTFFATTVSGATDINISCFAAGTAILTETGPMAVEHLTEGQRVITGDGGAAEIVWIGHRAIDCTRHPDPTAVWPVRILAGAFGEALPIRDLYLSPDHAVFVEGVLIPVRCLVNGTSIHQEPTEAVVYYHVELPAHDVILAEGLPVESYLDTGDRGNFSNGAGPVALFPDFSARMWEMAGHAPLVLNGPKVDRVRQALSVRAEMIPHRRAS